MSDETKNDTAFMQAIGAVGTARSLSPYITNRDDARKVYDVIVQMARKMSEQHNFGLTPKPKSASVSLKS